MFRNLGVKFVRKMDTSEAQRRLQLLDEVGFSQFPKSVRAEILKTSKPFSNSNRYETPTAETSEHGPEEY